ncbi:MAG: penicillin acylase family protein [Acidobacteriota bacterium]
MTRSPLPGWLPRWAASLSLAFLPLAGVALPHPAALPGQTIRVAGLRQSVEILLDRWGVPHIFAGNEPDAFLAQGFNAARDRLFQIDVWRRRGLGELAEVFGPDFVEQDRAARLFLYRGDMEREWATYSPERPAKVRQIAVSFAAGINAYIDFLADHREALPWEFRQLGYFPAKWRPEDVVRIRSHGLTRNLTSEVARANTACRATLEADALRIRLTPPWRTRVPDGLDPCLPPDVLKVFTLASRDLVLAPVESTGARSLPRPASFDPEPAEGSNNWVIAPRKSATGRPILANDPHRAYSVPSLRYVAHVSAPGLNIIGAGEPALPGVSIGHNGVIAFGLTIFAIDQEDLYVYDLNPANPGEYRYAGAWEPFRVLREEIRVRDAAAVQAELSFARHGPVIFVDREKNRAYGVRSAWLEAGMSPYFGSVDTMRAKTFERFRRSMAHWGAPTENQVYADVRGNIGWVAGGLAPRRPNWDGLLPVPGDGRYEWAGFWRGDQLPFAFNPESGFIATANQMNLPPGYPREERRLGFEWGNPSRYERLVEVLSALHRVSIADSLRLQNDLFSIPARRLVALLAPLSAPDTTTAAALEMLKGWDFVERGTAAAPALFEVWVSRHLGKAFREAVVPPAASQAIAAIDFAVLLEGLESPGSVLENDPAAAARKRDDLMLSTLRAAWTDMETLEGPDPTTWKWDRLHHNLLQHPFSAIVGAAQRAKINVGPLPRGGGPHTPNVSSYRPADFRQTSGASVRLVIDVGRWDESRAINYPGQSGDPDSPHYRDLAPSWLAGESFPLLYSRRAIERSAERRIVLVPARRRPSEARKPGGSS